MNYSYISAPVGSSSSDLTLAIALAIVWVVLSVISLIALVIYTIGLWKVFVKGGRPGWYAIIPIFNIAVLCQIAGRPYWWVFLGLIPFVNIIWVVLSIIVSLDIAKAFGKSSIFGIIGLWLFSPIGYLILGFSSAQYTAPVASAPSTPPTTPAQSGVSEPPQVAPA